MTVNIEQLSAYYDGELAPEERRTVEAHLPGCADCQSALRQWLRLSRALASTDLSRARPRRIPAIVLAAVAAFLVLGSGVAVASGALNEVVKIAQAFGAASRPVTLEEARVTNLPLPRSNELPGGWRLNQVQLTMTPTWRSVDVQYRRPGSLGMGVTVWSQDIIVNPWSQRPEVITVSGVPVEVGYGPSNSRSRWATARFTHDESTVIIRIFTEEVDDSGIRALVAAWIEQARR
jgi:hypothetical protein